MAYEIKPTPDHSLIRSRHTGEWVLQKRNTADGYFATIKSFGERLSLNDVGEIARIVGVDAGNLACQIESTVRRGGAGMGPIPSFEFRKGVTI